MRARYCGLQLADAPVAVVDHNRQDYARHQQGRVKHHRADVYAEREIIPDLTISS